MNDKKASAQFRLAREKTYLLTRGVSVFNQKQKRLISQEISLFLFETGVWHLYQPQPPPRLFPRPL